MGAKLHQKALTASAGAAWPAARTVPQIVTARLFGVSFSALLGGRRLLVRVFSGAVEVEVLPAEAEF